MLRVKIKKANLNQLRLQIISNIRTLLLVSGITLRGICDLNMIEFPLSKVTLSSPLTGTGDWLEKNIYSLKTTPNSYNMHSFNAEVKN